MSFKSYDSTKLLPFKYWAYKTTNATLIHIEQNYVYIVKKKSVNVTQHSTLKLKLTVIADSKQNETKKTITTSLRSADKA